MPGPASGYSGTPLPRKLGIREGHAVAVAGFDGDPLALLGPLPAGATLVGDPAEADVTVALVTERARLEAELPALGEAIFPDRTLWIGWPKRASGVATDVSEDTIREVALPLGLVDTKVCAIDATWSGLRLVWRKQRRRTGGELESD